MFQPHLTDHFDSNEALEQIEFVIGDFFLQNFRIHHISDGWIEH